MGIEKERFLNPQIALFCLLFSENFGLVVGEAMSYRLPVIVSNQTHWLEIEKLNAGWVIEPTIVSLRSILKTLLDTDKITLQKWETMVTTILKITITGIKLEMKCTSLM